MLAQFAEHIQCVEARSRSGDLGREVHIPSSRQNRLVHLFGLVLERDVVRQTLEVLLYSLLERVVGGVGDLHVEAEGKFWLIERLLGNLGRLLQLRDHLLRRRGDGR